MRLDELVEDTGVKIDPAFDLDIKGLTADSRDVKPGFLFAAFPGSTADGRDFIPDAIRKGARAVLAPTGTPEPKDSPIILLTDHNPRRCFAKFAARFYGDQPDLVAAVTGTNGKTSVAHFTQQLLQFAGLKAGSIGTLGAHGPGVDLNESLTTPDPVMLHQILAQMAKAGAQAAVMEASSHGLDQCRQDGVRISVAGFTNLGRDHLDYHGTLEVYFAAKMRLFTEVMIPGGIAVLNADIPQYDALVEACTGAGHKVLSYGTQGQCLKLAGARAVDTGTDLHLEIMGKAHRFVLPLIGTFQVSNALCALGMALAGGIDIDRAIEGLQNLKPVRGRLEPIATTPDGAQILVDYAHTPDGLEAALSALKPHAAGQLVVVFGAGGDRDPGKRPIMGEIAAKLADLVVVTDDNPRTEDPAAIRHAVIAGCSNAKNIGDRKTAIAEAISGLGPQDVLLVAGKGHETGQIVGKKVLPFNDADVIRALLQKDSA